MTDQPAQINVAENAEVAAVVLEPDVSDLLPPIVRKLVYLAWVMASAAWAIAAANTDVHWAWEALYAAVGAGVGALALSNTRARRV